MLGKKPAPAEVQKPTDKIDTLIGPNTEINGDVNFSGGLRVDGRLSGNVSARDASNDSLLTISEHGEITGNVPKSRIEPTSISIDKDKINKQSA